MVHSSEKGDDGGVAPPNPDSTSKEQNGGEEVVVPDGYEMIEEGQARMVFKKAQKNCGEKGQEVFYNPVQVKNRDLSVLMIAMYAERRMKRKLKKNMMKEKRQQLLKETGKRPHEIQNVNIEEEWFKMESSVISWADKVVEAGSTDGLRILDALAATGLRSVRYAKEVPGVREVIVNDLDEVAVEQAKKNITFNHVSPDKMKAHHGDATMVMYSNRGKKHENMGERFDVVDLDPYGTAAPFIDAAVQAVADGGLLCITCTDMAVLSGGHPETCFARYSAMPMPKGRYLHELALRILLQTISTSANRYGRTIRPVLSVGMDFYIRVFVEVSDDRAGTRNSSLQVGYVFQSTQCPTFYTVASGVLNGKAYQPCRGAPVEKCQETGAPFKIAGPMWMGPLHDFDVVDEAVKRLDREELLFPLKTRKPLHGLLTAVGEELSDVPLFYTLSDICHTLSCQMPPMIVVRAALANAGYRSSAQHKEPMAIKTDAPPSVLWDIFRVWVKKHPINEKRKNNNSSGQKILSVEAKIDVDFTVPKGFRAKKKAQRYPMNPEPNWGPKPRATGKRRVPESESVSSRESNGDNKKKSRDEGN